MLPEARLNDEHAVEEEGESGFERGRSDERGVGAEGVKEVKKKEGVYIYI